MPSPYPKPACVPLNLAKASIASIDLGLGKSEI